MLLLCAIYMLLPSVIFTTTPHRYRSGEETDAESTNDLPAVTQLPIKGESETISVGLNHSDFLTCILAVSYFKYKDTHHLECDTSKNSQLSAIFI